MPAHLIPIQQLEDRRLDVYRDLNRANLTVHSGRFVVEGRTLVERLVASRFEVESILVSQRRVSQLPEGLPDGLPVWVVPHRWIDQIIGFHFHRGMLACGVRRPMPALEQWLPHPPDPLLLCIGDRLVDPTNLGGVVRNCCAFGAAGLMLGPGCADPFSRRVIRVSMGTALTLPVWTAADLGNILGLLRDTWQVELVATVLDADAEPLEHAARRSRMALVLGSEGHGITPEILRHCDRRVTLRMCGGTDSLNVATASAVFLYHFARQPTMRRREV